MAIPLLAVNIGQVHAAALFQGGFALVALLGRGPGVQLLEGNFDVGDLLVVASEALAGREVAAGIGAGDEEEGNGEQGKFPSRFTVPAAV